VLRPKNLLIWNPWPQNDGQNVQKLQNWLSFNLDIIFCIFLSFRLILRQFYDLEMPPISTYYHIYEEKKKQRQINAYIYQLRATIGKVLPIKCYYSLTKASWPCGMGSKDTMIWNKPCLFYMCSSVPIIINLEKLLDLHIAGLDVTVALLIQIYSD
jgi:hypothetical protein